jgi:putative FmdB family regulatory protein
MPIYEYDCARCGVFEATQRITEDPLSRCPTCRSKVKKLISQTSFQLKGTGWYATDYGHKSNDSNDSGAKERSASRESSNGKESTDSDSKKCEAKCEAKKEGASA